MPRMTYICMPRVNSLGAQRQMRKTTAETQTNLLDPGVTLRILTTDGNTVIYPSVSSAVP